MKIHEQEWTYRGLSGDVVGPDGLVLTADDAPDDALRLIAAAPKMARALLEIRSAPSNNTLDPDGAHEVCERALHDAGVL